MWTAPRTWVVSEVVTASLLNTHVRDNLNALWVELAYVEFTSDVAVTTSSTEGSPLDIVSAGAVTYVNKPIVVEFFCAGININTNSGGTFGASLWDGTDLGRMFYPAAANPGAQHWVRRLTPSAGSHTYKVRGFSTVNTQTVRAGAGGVATTMPGFIRVLQQGSA